ncbi:hypothetical protein L798_04867 [Zootermopsis nevadensis]|uniref:Uncharacterized protein n=1 Tax=Zootermopsis nevadensis TaxID=136037 RepID=A0A067RAL6_ZOONE|nr:hypothetical protein L798_04867 [Zootermopsis nevadensis]
MKLILLWLGVRCLRSTWEWSQIMGAQQAKERVGSSGALAVRNTVRNKPRVPKDGRQQGSNIFTEHSGECALNLGSKFNLCSVSYFLIIKHIIFCTGRHLIT